MNKEIYSQDWQAYNEAQTKEKRIVMNFLNELLQFVPEEKSNVGRPTAPLRDMLFCCMLKVYLGFSSRRLISDLEFAKKMGFIEKVPHFNTVLNYFNHEELAPILTKLIITSALPLKEVELDFAVDATGFSTSNYEKWLDVRQAKVRARKFMKAHVITGTGTNIITDIVVTKGNTHDTVPFPRLVKRTSNYFNLREISADKAYSNRNNLQLVSDCGAIPFIPYKKNAKPRAAGSRIWKQMYHYYVDHRDEFMTHYHKRSNVETTFSMIKRKFGLNLRSKNEIAQINEVLCKALCHNLCVLVQEMFELGIDVDFGIAAALEKTEKSRPRKEMRRLDEFFPWSAQKD